MVWKKETLGKDEDHPDIHHTRYYTLLCLRKNCSLDEIKTKFKILSRVFHPDKKGLSDQGQPLSEKVGVEDTFVELQHCASILSDRVLRLAYDYGGSSAVQIVALNSPRLYTSMQDANSISESIFLLQQSLEAFEHEDRRRELQRHRTGITKAKTSINYCMVNWERESSSVYTSIQRTLSLNQSLVVMVSASHQLKHRSLASMSFAVGSEHTAANATNSLQSGTTTYATEIRFINSDKNKDGNFCFPLPYGRLSTKRQLVNGTIMHITVSGHALRRETWRCSILSNRHISFCFRKNQITNSCIHKDDIQSTHKIHASWGIGLQAISGKLDSLTAQLSTVDPDKDHYRVRLSISNPHPLKVTYRSSACNRREGGLSVSYSMAWFETLKRIKLAWTHRLCDRGIICTYGLKYDRTARMGSLPMWTIVSRLDSSALSIRLPIYLTSQANALPRKGAWMLTMLMSMWVRVHLQEWFHKCSMDRLFATSSLSTQVRSENDTQSVSKVLVQYLLKTLQEIAAHKKALEQSRDGLVILAVSVDGVQDVHLLDLMQFWVNESSVCIPFEEFHFKLSQPHLNHIQDDVNGLKRLILLLRRLRSTASPIPNSRLTVRYQYRSWVYETFFMRFDCIIELPSMRRYRTTRLGLKCNVH